MINTVEKELIDQADTATEAEMPLLAGEMACLSRIKVRLLLKQYALRGEVRAYKDQESILAVLAQNELDFVTGLIDD